VLVELRGNVRLCRVNVDCLVVCPSAAQRVTGQIPRSAPLPAECRPPVRQGGVTCDDGSMTSTEGEVTV
jgi:hypothetical protein